MANDMFERVSFFKSGYDCEQVDKFFTDARASYENVVGSEEFTAEKVREVAFDEKYRGYVSEEVDAALDRLEAAFLQRERADHVSVNGKQAWLDLVAERATTLYPRLRRPAGEKFAHPQGREIGYDAEEVDAFLQEIADFFDDKKELTVEDVRAVTFSPARKNKAYKEGPVDAYLSRAAEVLLAIQ